MSKTITPKELVNSLDAKELHQRLDELEAERAAVIVLLRAVRARERARQHDTQPKAEVRS
jgi:hypothetical protein